MCQLQFHSFFGFFLKLPVSFHDNFLIENLTINRIILHFKNCCIDMNQTKHLSIVSSVNMDEAGF